MNTREEFRSQQAKYRYRAWLAKRGRVFWKSNTDGTYDPYGKLKAKWAETSAKRKARNEARKQQLAISRGRAT